MGTEYMTRHLTLIGAASSIGIKAYDNGTPRHVDRAPATLRQLGLGAALGARDVRPEPYRDFVRPPSRVRNEPQVVRYSHLLAERVAPVLSDGGFPIVIGGDCSNVLGSLLGARRAGQHRVGLAYIDAHADFATPADSATGSAASMDLALVASPRAIGLQLTIYDPALDPGLDCGRRLVSLLRAAFEGRMVPLSG